MDFFRGFVWLLAAYGAVLILGGLVAWMFVW
jgi:hypothetical protein